MIRRNFAVCLLLVFSFSALSASGQDEDAKSPKSSPKKPSSTAPKTNKIQPTTKSVPKTVNAPKKVSPNKSVLSTKPTSSSKKEKNTTATLELTVNESGSSIEINRLEKGAAINVESATGADSGDTLLFESLQPGDYLVKVRKNGFYEQQLKVTLKAGKTAGLNAVLKPSTGFLTVVSNVEDKVIEIKGFGSFVEKVENLAVAPQQYEISISADGYEPVTRRVDVRLGQTTIVDGNLKLIEREKLLQIAKRDYQNGLYKETIANCRLILEQKDDDALANLLIGYAYFYTNRPRESRFYLARALGLQMEAEIPVKIYQKEKNSETLTDGVLKINRNNLSFYSAKRPELNFNISPSSISKLEINQDKNNSNSASSKPDSVEIRASVSSGKKTEKKILRLYPRQAFARVIAQNKAEIATCTNCSNVGCLCQTEIRAVYELLLNWKSGSFPRGTNASSSVAPPSAGFTRFDGQGFSLSLPDNWLKTTQTDNPMWFAPTGGFFSSQNRVQYVYALNAGVLPITANDLRSESERFYQSILSANGYLEQQSEPKEIFISGRKGLTASFVGFNAEIGEEEFVQIYTTFTREGNLFFILTVTPFEKRQEYRRTFRSILNSVNF